MDNISKEKNVSYNKWIKIRKRNGIKSCKLIMFLQKLFISVKNFLILIINKEYYFKILFDQYFKFLSTNPFYLFNNILFIYNS
jgi:hypothetical protein